MLLWKRSANWNSLKGTFHIAPIMFCSHPAAELFSVPQYTFLVQMFGQLFLTPYHVTQSVLKYLKCSKSAVSEVFLRTSLGVSNLFDLSPNERTFERLLFCCVYSFQQPPNTVALTHMHEILACKSRCGENHKTTSVRRGSGVCQQFLPRVLHYVSCLTVKLLKL